MLFAVTQLLLLGLGASLRWLMPEITPPSPPFELLERSDLFSFLRELIQNVYAPSISTTVRDYELVIVGGQSLALWARQYLIDELTGEDIGFVTSDDLDFIGNNAAVGYCEKVMNTKFKRATLDDFTPNLAIGVIDWKEDRRIVVDILKMDSVAGVTKTEIMKHLSVIDLNGTEVALIDPVTCLKSRVYNLFADWQHDRYRESIRTRIAIRASDCYIRELIVYEGFRSAAPQIKRIKKLASSNLGLRAYVEYGIDILKAIPNDPMIFPKEYMSIEHPKMVAMLRDLRMRKIEFYKARTISTLHESHK